MAVRSKSRSKGTRAARSPRQQAQPRRSDRTLIIIGLVLLVAIIVATAISFFRSPAPVAGGDEVLVTIDGEPLMRSQLEFQYRLLPDAYRAQLDEGAVLEQIIDEQLVVQAAAREGVAATPEDVNERVQGILADNQVTIVQLSENLAMYNVTLEEFESLVARQITLDRYTNKTIQVPEPTDEDLQAIYDLNTARFTTDEQVIVRHVLVSTQRTDAAIIAKEVYDSIRAGADICAIAANTSDDKGSRDTCGEYTFGRGYMVPEFETASFEMEPGDVRLVQTQFGYHVIQKVKDVPAGVLPFSEVRESLRDEWRAAEYLRLYKILVSDLRDEATIEYVGVPAPSGGLVVAPDAAGSEVSTAPSPAADDVVVVPTEDDATLTAPSAIAPATGPSSDPDDLMGCIADSAVLYGTGWSSDTTAARKLFSDAGVTLAYVACDEDVRPCKDADIEAYPTWIIQGVTYPGRMTVEELRRAAGC